MSNLLYLTTSSGLPFFLERQGICHQEKTCNKWSFVLFWVDTWLLIWINKKATIHLPEKHVTNTNLNCREKNSKSSISDMNISLTSLITSVQMTKYTFMGSRRQQRNLYFASNYTRNDQVVHEECNLIAVKQILHKLYLISHGPFPMA